MLNIFKPEIKIDQDYAQSTAVIGLNDTNKTLWFRVKKEHAHLLSDASDAHLIALLIPAMAHGTDIRVKGNLSEKLFHNATRLQAVLKRVIPQLEKVNITPGDLYNTRDDNACGVATGFSCGVDSFAVLADYWQSELPNSFQLTHLIFNNVGQHGRDNSDLQAEKRFEKRYSKNLKAAHKIDLPLIYVNSNVNAFYENTGLDHKQTHTLRNASVAHLLSSGIGRFYYASALSYNHIYVGKARNTTSVDPIILPLLSTEKLEAISVGCEYTRVEKTVKISALEDTCHYLDVCTKSDGIAAGNCSACQKCLRTQLTLDILGMLDQYKPVFDLEKYRNRKSEYIAKVLTSDDPQLEGIEGMMEDNNFPIPSEVYIHILRIKRKKYKEFIIRNIKKPMRWLNF